MRKVVITGLLIGSIGLATWFLRPKPSIHQSETISTPAPELGPRAHKLLPNLKEARVVVPDRPHDPMEVFSTDKSTTIQRTRSFQVSTNLLGFRDAELEDQLPIEIVCVGDSVTFGWGVAEAEAYPTQLEQLLQKGVLNTGVPALKPEHVEAYLLSFIHTLSPKLVLIAMRPNWMTPNPIGTYTQTMKRIATTLKQKGIEFGIILPPLASFDPKGRSNNFQEVSQIYKSLPEIPILDLTPIFDANLPDTGLRLGIQDSHQQIIDRKSGTIVLEASFPKPPQSLAPEIVRYFEEHPNVQEPLFFDGGHPDAEGFILFSKSVANWIEEQGWLAQ